MASKWNQFNSQSSTKAGKTTTSKGEVSSSWEQFNGQVQTSSNSDKEVPKEKGILESIAAGILKTPARILTNVVNAGQIATNKPLTKPFSGDFLGDVKPVGQTGDFKKDLLDSVGVGLEMSSYIPIAGGVSRSLSLLKSSPKWLKFAAPLAVEGGAGAFLASTGNEISDYAQTGNKIDLKQIGISTGVGAIAAPTLGSIFSGIGRLGGKAATNIAEQTPTIPKNPIASDVADVPKQLTPQERLAIYSKAQGYEPYPKDVPTIDFGGPSNTKLPTIKFDSPTETLKMPGYKYVPVKDNVYQDIVPLKTNIPEARTYTAPTTPRIPKTTKGTVVSKAAAEIDTKLVSDGFDALPIEEQARFTPVTRAKQVQDIARFMKSNYEDSIDVALGKKGAPKNIDTQILFNTVVKQAEKNSDVELMRSLAKSPIASQRSVLAQKLGAAAVNKSEKSAVELIADNDRNIAEQIFKRTGKTVEQIHDEEIAKIVAKKAPVDKKTFSEFINSVIC